MMKNLTIPVTVALFDMDGVIFEGSNFWLDLHRCYGTEKEAWELADRYMNSDYQLLSEITVQKLWIGRSETVFSKLVGDRCFSRGVHGLFRFLKERNVRTAIISSGPLQLAKRAQSELGIDILRANEVHFENGRFNGEVDVQVHDNDKVSVGLDVIRQLGGNADSTLFVGDTISDVGLAEAVGVSIAYDTKCAELQNVSDHLLSRGELGRIRELVTFPAAEERDFSFHNFTARSQD